MLLFRSSLSSGGGGDNCDNFGANVEGQFLAPIKIEIPPVRNAVSDSTNFNEPVTIGEYVTSCPGLFEGLPNFNQPVNIPLNASNLMGIFYDCSNFNQPIRLPISKDAGIPNAPLDIIDLRYAFGYSAFNQPINNFPAYFIGDSMFEGSSFNCPIDLSNSTTIGLEKMFYDCQEFNQPVEIYNILRIEEANLFLPNNLMLIYNDTSLNEMFAGCSNFNSPVTFNNEAITTDGLSFYRTFADSAFNCPIDFSSMENSRGHRHEFHFEETFDNTPFNQPIIFPYLYGARYGRDQIYLEDAFGENFNQPIQLDGECTYSNYYPRFKSRGLVPCNFNQSVNISPNIHCNLFEYGFSGCQKLNHPVNLPTFEPFYIDGGDGQYECSISELFYECSNFNQPLNFNFKLYTGGLRPSLYSIYMNNVMYNCTNFNSPVTFDFASDVPVYIDASSFFEECSNFNPRMENLSEGYFFDSSFLYDASNMFLNCSNFNINWIKIPEYTENCYQMFKGCNHINHILLLKYNEYNPEWGPFDFNDLDLNGFLANTSNELKCEIFTNYYDPGRPYLQGDYSPLTYEKVLEADLVYSPEPISWINESWGSYNTYYNIYVIQDYNNYVNWTP